MGLMNTMDNQEEILDALNDFEKKPNQEIPPVLEQFLQRIAKTGETLFPWPRLKPLLASKMDDVMKNFNQEVPGDHYPMCPNVENVRYDDMRSRILSSLDAFQGAPFTIQRLCELITNPKRHYNRSDKFLRGLEKNVLVVSTVDPFGRKIVSESRSLVNGLDSNGQVELRDDVSGSNYPSLWAPKNNVWPFHPESLHTSTIVTRAEATTGKDTNNHHQESMDSCVEKDHTTNDVLQNSEDITSSPALHPVQEALVETSVAQHSLDVIPDLLDSHPMNEVTSEAEEIHSVLVENCAIPETLSNVSQNNSVVTTNVEKVNLPSEVAPERSLTPTSQSGLTASNTVSIVTSDLMQESVLTSQSFDRRTSEIILDSVSESNTSSEHVNVESVYQVNEGNKQESDIDTRSDQCVSNSDSASFLDSSRDTQTNAAISPSELGICQPVVNPPVIHQSSFTDQSVLDLQSDITSDKTSKKLDNTCAGNADRGPCNLQTYICPMSNTKPDSTLTSDFFSTDNVDFKTEVDSHASKDTTEEIDKGDNFKKIKTTFKTDSSYCGNALASDVLQSGDCESIIGSGKPDLVNSGEADKSDNSFNDKATSPSCSDHNMSSECSSTVHKEEEGSHSKDHCSSELLTHSLNLNSKQMAAEPLTQICSVETTVKIEISGSNLVQDKQESMDQD